MWRVREHVCGCVWLYTHICTRAHTHTHLVNKLVVFPLHHHPHAVLSHRANNGTRIRFSI